MEQFYAVTAPHGTIYVTAADADRVEAALTQGHTQIRIRDHLVALNAGMSIFKAEEYIAMQNEKLNARGSWMCRSGVVHHAESRCECKAETRKARGQTLLQNQPVPESTPQIRAPRDPRALPASKGPVRLGDIVGAKK